MSNTSPTETRLGDAEALTLAEAMVARYEYRVSLHPDTGPATERQRTEARNLTHWQRRLDAIATKNAPFRRNR